MYKINPAAKIKSTVCVGPDKSISHRALIFSAFCPQKTKIYPFLESEDALATLDCITRLGIQSSVKKGILIVRGQGLYFPKKQKVCLFAGESGTTIRILTGLLSAQRFSSYFKAGVHLSKRPMGRIIYPLREMGAVINAGRQQAGGKKEELYPPLEIRPSARLTGRFHNLPIASAQVKSALLLAGLFAEGKTIIKEPFKSRDHTERMLESFGADIETKKNTVTLAPGKILKSPEEIFIPSDFSSAAFFIVLGLILNDSRVIIEKVNINPARCGLLAVLKKMNADIKIENQYNEIEPYADITVESSRLTSVIVEPKEIPAMVDEVPVLCVAAAFARGQTEIKGVKELKVKETDRIHSMVSNLSQAGVDIIYKQYGKDDLKIVINGANSYKGGKFLSYADHRTAMSLIIFALAAKAPSIIDDVECINKSFPGFTRITESFA